MSETFLDGRVVLHGGDCLEVMRSLPENSFDAIVCDPPYHLASIVKRFGKAGSAPAKDYSGEKEGATGAYARASSGFMGQKWDGGDIAFDPATWMEALRVLKPGGHLLAFGAPKNFGFMQVAIADAGFEIRDVVAWLFGTGFPKSHNVGRSIDKAGDGDSVSMSQIWAGWGTALKPAYEPIIMARKPLIGTVAENVLAHGTGALNIDECRVGTDGATKRSHQEAYGPGGRADQGGDQNWRTGHGIVELPLGRWPANVVHDGSDEVLAAFPHSKGQQGDVRGTELSHTGDQNTVCYDEFGRVSFQKRNDAGSSARFFYSAKASKMDRAGSKHPTVKPISLMRYLIRLVTARGQLVLDPFAGTGSTGEAAWQEGRRCVLIEREESYQEDIRRRMKYAAMGPEERARAEIATREQDPWAEDTLFKEAA